jgi:3'-phosphoadenosine 5'-phosphosulfate sulfotransferase (PAPS reductase)/FAD synthetase
MLTVSWFSAGVSSAVATKLMIDDIDRIIYTHIDDQHPDTLRFIAECENWFGKPVEILQSVYHSVEEACFAAGGRGYVNGPGGAACTKWLKRRVRMEWEKAHTEPLRYVWGLDYGEIARCERLHETMPNQEHVFPLVDRRWSKEMAHQTLSASGINRPAMYELGYSNNNCVGCVKGGKGYWNHIRHDFPDVFAARAKMERAIQATCIKGVYLDELDPEAGRHEAPILDDCGILCELLAI